MDIHKLLTLRKHKMVSISPNPTQKKKYDWRILVVDDTPDNLGVAKATLQFHGIDVQVATSGEEGLRMLQDFSPAALLLDIRMPTMDGWAVLKSIRANPATAHIAIIAITAYAMMGDEEAILAGGFDGYIPKPIDVLKFADQINNILEATHLTK